MACRLVGAKPLSEPMLEYCSLDPYEQSSVKFKSELKHFHTRKCLKMSSVKWRPFCLGLNVLKLLNISKWGLGYKGFQVHLLRCYFPIFLKITKTIVIILSISHSYLTEICGVVNPVKHVYDSNNLTGTFVRFTEK